MQVLRFVPFGSAAESLERQRLTDLVLRAAPVAANSVIVAAPAGYGKTTLLVQVAELLEKGQHTLAWLNCAPEDAQAETFLGSLAASLRNAGLFDLKGDFGITEIVASLAAKGRAAIFLDEYEQASSEETDNLLETLIRLLPDHTKLFVATRALPRISLSKLLVSGRTRCVAAEDLRFTRDEVEQLLGHLGSSDTYAHIIERADGWPVIVQLARLHIENAGSPARKLDSGLERNARIFSYIAEQVLRKQNAELQDFLLEISILSEVDVTAAASVSGRQNAEALLHQTLQLSPIVARIGEDPFSVRLHPLFRDFLEEERASRGAIDASLLHQRAAAHFAARKDLSKAIHHASRSGSNELTAELLEAAGGILLIVSEGFGAPQSFLDAIPSNLVSARPRLRLLRTVLEAMDSNSADSFADFERFAHLHRSRQDDAAALDTDFELQIDLVTAICQTNESRFTHREAPWSYIAQLRGRCLERRYDEPRYLAILTLLELNFILDFGSTALAGMRVRELRELIAQQEWTPSLFWLGHAALISLLKGDLRDSENQSKVVLERLLDAGITRANNMNNHCNAMMGQSLYEQNQLELALAHFDAVPRFASYIPLHTQVFSTCTRARCLVHMNRKGQAIAELTDAHQLAVDEGLPHFAIISAAVCGELKLLEGDMSGARALAGSAELEAALEKSATWFSRPWTETEALVSFFSKLWMHEGNAVRAYDIAHEFAMRAAQSGRTLMSARSELIAAHAALELDRAAHARAAIKRAVESTAGSLATRMFLDCSADVLAVVQQMAARNEIEASDWVGTILDAPGDDTQTNGGSSESLSPRELEVVAALSAGHPTKIIARQLGLSHETVRHHLKRIYAKFRVHSRQQAVAEAKRRGIVD